MAQERLCPDDVRPANGCDERWSDKKDFDLVLSELCFPHFQSFSSSVPPTPFSHSTLVPSFTPRAHTFSLLPATHPYELLDGCSIQSMTVRRGGKRSPKNTSVSLSNRPSCFLGPRITDAIGNSAVVNVPLRVPSRRDS